MTRTRRQRSTGHDPIATYAACVEVAAAHMAVAEAIEERRQLLDRLLRTPGVPAEALALQLGINRATLYRWVADAEAYEAAQQRRLPVVEGPETPATPKRRRRATAQPEPAAAPPPKPGRAKPRSSGRSGRQPAAASTQKR